LLELHRADILSVFFGIIVRMWHDDHPPPQISRKANSPRFRAFSYKKSGVMLMGLQAKGSIQPTLFDEPINQAKSDNLMQVMDAINQKIVQGSLTIAASGLGHGCAMRRERMSPNCTTDWNELPVAV